MKRIREEDVRRDERRRIAETVKNWLCIVGGLMGAASFLIQYFK